MGMNERRKFEWVCACGEHTVTVTAFESAGRWYAEDSYETLGLVLSSCGCCGGVSTKFPCGATFDSIDAQNAVDEATGYKPPWTEKDQRAAEESALLRETK